MISELLIFIDIIISRLLVFKATTELERLEKGIFKCHKIYFNKNQNPDIFLVYTYLGLMTTFSFQISEKVDFDNVCLCLYCFYREAVSQESLVPHFGGVGGMGNYFDEAVW